jgi:diaminohydroxyphosphoribosylaminopyrimidine deaminase / 5-amino-6-(5-phosphoribosylamino)uracil reductase
LVSSTQHSHSQTEQTSDAFSHQWEVFFKDFLSSAPLSASPLQALFETIRQGEIDSMMVVGQLGQTMDGRIATVTGQSKYINGLPGLTHLHQLRALLDAVVVGVGTAIADDPQLNVRLVSGKNPARVVIDPKGKLNPHARVWLEDGARRLWVVSEGVEITAPAGVEIIALPALDGRIAPPDILKMLASAWAEPRVDRRGCGNGIALFAGGLSGSTALDRCAHFDGFGSRES